MFFVVDRSLGMTNGNSGDDEEEEPLYSPVSPDAVQSSSEEDYDDIAN